MIRNPKLPDLTQKAIVQAFTTRGLSPAEIAFTYQTSVSTVRRILGAEGLVKCVDSLPREQLKMLRALEAYGITTPAQLDKHLQNAALASATV